MTNLLTDIGTAHHYFKPAYRADNRLMGMEVMTRLVTMDAAETRHQVWQAAHLDAAQQMVLFNEKIALIEQFKILLASWKITVWVNINDTILTEIMQNPDWVTRLQDLSFLTLMITEDFPGMNYGRNNLRLIWVSEKFPLALANLGAGNAAIRAISDGLFTHIFLDQEFVHHQATRPSFVPFSNAIIRQIAPFCDALLISGIDDIAMYNRVRRLSFAAMRGNLWPDITPEQLASLFTPSDSEQ